MADPAAVPDFTFAVDGNDDGTLRVLSFEGAEGLSEIWRYDLQLTSREPALEFADYVGKKAVLKWTHGDDERVTEGIIARFEQLHHGRVLTYYSARLVPKLFALTLRKRSRMFQEMTTPDILKKVLADGGISGGSAVAFKLNASYVVRKYCVQYRETDFDFISRLMEEEGITYCFPQGDGDQAMTLLDKASSHTVIAGEAELPFRSEDTGMSGADEIRQFAFRRAMRSGSVRLREFDFVKNKMLETFKKADDEAQLEVYDYPGEYPETGIGNRLAQVRLEEERAERDVGVGASNCRRMVAGFRFTMAEHQRESLNAEYLLTSVQHTARQPMAAEEDQVEADMRTAYRNEFRCIPAATQYRPPRLTPRPVIDGVQTAVVVGDGEIDPDKHGRVKVQFYWDQEDKQSTWVRVSQGWGGAGWGGMFIPRVGHEVIVEFIEGDPDRPIITGRVYNGTNPPPYELPAKKTVSTIMSNTSPGGGGSNELRFEDKSGSEEIYAHAQKDWNTVIENDRTRMVGNDETIHIKHDRTKTVDNDQMEEVKKNKIIKVGVNHDEKIDGDKKLTVDGSHTESIGSDMTIKVMSSLSETVVANYSEKVGAAMELTVAGAYNVSVGAAMSESVSGSKDASVNGASSETVGKAKSVTVSDEMTETIGKAAKLEIGKDYEVKIGGKHKEETTKEFTLKAKKVMIEAEDEIQIKTGSAQITMKKSGDITIKGGKINIEGSGDVKIKGSKVAGN